MNYDDNNKAPSCLECGREIYGRPDKKFCGEHCKNKFNNRKNNYFRNIRNRTETILCRNHSILEKLLFLGIKSIGLGELTSLGFNISYVTGHCRGRKRHDEYQCFDIAYCKSETKIFCIRKIIYEKRKS